MLRKSRGQHTWGNMKGFQYTMQDIDNIHILSTEDSTVKT